MDTLTFGIATPDDIDDLVELVQSAYRGEPSRAGWTTEADLIDGQRIDHEMLAELLANPDSVVLVARQDGALVGCCELGRPSDDEPAYLGMFAVRPDLQGRGVGKVVLDEAERFVAEEWNVDRVELTVIDVREELIAWYARRGYEPTGEVRPFPYGDDRFGVPTRDDLQFAVLLKHL